MNARSARAAAALSIAFAVLALAGSAFAQPGPGPGPGPLPPPPPAPPQNPVTQQKAVLGKILFWDEQLSSDNRVSCGSCHRPNGGGTDLRVAVNPGLDGLVGTPDDKRASPGIVRSDANNAYLPDAVFGLQPQVTRRSSPKAIGAQYSPVLFWDGRATGTFTDPQSGLVVIPAGGALESQALAPILNTGEMAHDGRTWAEVAAKLQAVKPLKLATNLPADVAGAITANPTYGALFTSAFGDSTITAQRIAFAIATYERTLVPNQTPFDAFAAGNPNALTPNQQLGLQVFNGPARCNICHGGATFTNNSFRNVGLRPLAEDRGRQEVTNNPADAGRFKVPTLRNVSLKSRFMHNGQFANLSEVVAFYERGGDFPANRDPAIIPLILQPNQRAALLDFLTNALVDPRVSAQSFPFDRPTLYADTHSPASAVFGVGHAGSGGLEPRILAAVPPSLANPDFKIGIADALGGATAVLVLADAQNVPAVQAGSIPLNVDLGSARVIAQFVLGGSGPGNGFGTFAIGVPGDPAFVGLQLFGQWFVVDPAAGDGVAASRGASFQIF